MRRLLGADVVRVMAMLMVIVLHTMLSFTLRPDFFGSKLWWLFEPIVALSRTSVLLFFILSGYLILNKKRSIHEILHKTAWRILLPLTFFELMNVIYAYYRVGSSFFTFDLFLWSQFQRLSAAMASPLWFLVVLLFFYLCVPIIQRIFESKNDRILAIYGLCLTMIYSIFSGVISFMLPQTFFHNGLTYWFGYLSFFVYGAVVQHQWLKVNRNTNIFIFFCSMGLIIIGDYFGFRSRSLLNDQTLPIYTQSYLNIPIVFAALSLFNIVIKLDLTPSLNTYRERYWNKILTFISGLSFGIYLIHPYVVSFFSDIIQFDFDHLSMNVYIFNLLNFALVFGISALLTLVIKHIPLLKRVIGEN